MKITLTKPLAGQLLQNASRQNRQLDLPKITRYTHEINTGKWLKKSDSGLKIEYAKLTNGQHRLIAFIQSGLKQLDFEITVVRRCDSCGIDMVNTANEICETCQLPY